MQWNVSFYERIVARQLVVVILRVFLSAKILKISKHGYGTVAYKWNMNKKLQTRIGFASDESRALLWTTNCFRKTV